jgi:carbonic anhydrase
MRNKEMIRLLVGFKKFHERYFTGEKSFYDKLSSAGQSPKTLVIGCSDSRVDPAILTSSEPGELFTVRNVANLVPPYETNVGLHGVSSAIEFAVVDLKVENVIILGHRQCGGIRALMTSGPHRPNSFLAEWVQIAKKAKERVLAKYASADFDTQCRHCEMASIVTSMENLRTFPFIQDAVQERQMAIYGIYFDLELGQVFGYDEPEAAWTQVEV